MAKSRKWSNLKGVVPEHQDDEPSERELKIREECDKLRAAGANMPVLAQEWAGLEQEDEFESLASKERSIKQEALQRVVLEQLAQIEQLSGHDSWRGEGMLLSPQIKLIMVVTDRAQLKQYIHDKHLEDMLVLPEGKLKSLVTEKLEELMGMDPEERANQTATPLNPIPGVKVFMKRVVHKT